MRRDPRGSFLVESGRRWAELRAVHLTGRARIVGAQALLARVAAALAAKYAALRTPRATMPDTTRSHYDVATATIEITPDERLSWDNARLPLRASRG
ncbi:MAG: hypothetical protein U0802_09905 [Candidatus Binatia bacterium]